MKIIRKLLCTMMSCSMALNSFFTGFSLLKADAVNSADAQQWDYGVTVEQIKSMQNFLLNNTSDVKVTMEERFDINNDGRINVYDLVLLKRMYLEQTKKSGNFYSLSSDLVRENDTKYGTAIMSEDFYSKRVIVKAKTVYDFTNYSPVSVISGTDYIYVLQFDSVESAELCMTALRQDENIIYAELDEYMNCGKPETNALASANSWGVTAIEADQYAEYLSNTYNSSVVVAVVDTGVSSHSFLEGRVLNTGYDLVDNDSDPSDKHYHGTHVAGTVVDCTPELNVKILPVRVLDANGGGTYLNVGNGIRYAVEHGANIINLSLGGGCSAYIDDAIDYAVDNGVTVVVAAGNENSNTIYSCPAHLEDCIVVAACDSDNEKAYFSNYGNSVDVIAPGVDILSCIPGGGYRTLSGTSMATPHIAAAAAMIKYSHPQAESAEIEALLKEISLDLGDSGKDIYYGYGLPKLSNLIEDNPNVEPSILLSDSELSLKLGDSQSLSASTVPKAQTVNWSSSDSKVASVENGLVTALSEGTTTITASFVYNSVKYSAKCTIKVTDNSDSVIMSGQCGDEVYYSLDGNGLLTISGEGRMWNYNYNDIYWGRDNKQENSPFSTISAVERVVVDEGVTSIGICAFASCSNLKEISLPDSLTEINGYSFYDCGVMKEIIIPKNVSIIGEASQYLPEDAHLAFINCSALKSIYVDDENEKYADDNGALISKDGKTLYYVPLAKDDYVMSDQLVTLAESCARGNLSITELIIPKSVKSIGRNAFSGCSNLSSLQLNQGVETIGWSAFQKTAITSVHIPSSVTKIEEYVFYQCKLNSITFDQYGLEPLIINHDALHTNKDGIESITFPARTTVIGENAVDNNKLKYVEILGYNTIIAPNGYLSGSDYSVTFGENVEIHGYAGSTAEQYANEFGYTFVNMDEAFHIPTSGYLENNVYWELSNGVLTISGNGDMPDYSANLYYGYTVFDDQILPWWCYRNDIKKVVIEDGITSIGASAFHYCENLTEVIIPNSVRKINRRFIRETAVTEIIVPESVDELDMYAFGNASSLEKLTILNRNCTWNMEASSIPEDTVIYGYSGSTAETYATKFNRTFVAID